jgi:phage gp46-like protein
VTYATGLGASVTVHFNEPVSAVPGGWTVVPLGGGVPVAVNVVTMPDASTYLLTLNTSMTSQASYRVTAPGSITDLATNAIVGTTADFTAFEEVTRTYTAVSPAGAPTDAYACDLTGAPLDGYGPLDLYPASPVVTLARLVLTSLLSDREALASDRIPDGTTDRRGWWADSYNDDKRKTGSRLWLLASSPIRDDTAKQAKSYAEEALAWMVKDGIAAAVTVEAELQGSSQERRVAVGVTVTKDDGTGVRLQFPELWTIYGG